MTSVFLQVWNSSITSIPQHKHDLDKTTQRDLEIMSITNARTRQDNNNATKNKETTIFQYKYGIKLWAVTKASKTMKNQLELLINRKRMNERSEGLY